MRGEFAWSPEEADRAAKFADFSGELAMDMHEVIGHASGRMSDAVKASPQLLLKEAFRYRAIRPDRQRGVVRRVPVLRARPPRSG
jgi:hypothetical protein